jgi:hypothetical protein
MNDQVAVPEEALKEGQRNDLSALLAEHLTRGNIEMFAVRVLGREAVLPLAGNCPSIDELAHSVVAAMQQAGLLQEGVTTLRLDALSDGVLTLKLNHVLNGGRLSDLVGAQAIVQNQEDPFFDQTFQQLFPKVQRAVCAIGLGNNVNRLQGTGFLIGPNLVITNYHVIEPYISLTVENGVSQFKESESGEQIYCFFDYMGPPKPRVPPEPAWPHHSTCVRAVKDGWLRAARRRLRAEGIYPNDEEVGDQLDYAVFELARDIGQAPARASGGVLRGWLALPRNVNYLGGGDRPIIVAQHPQGAQQLYDIGGYDQLDPSQTRVWYRVNTAHGSSGGAAVDKACQLFALHNAEVRDPSRLRDPRMNQGVRIDKIAMDLQHCRLLPPPLDGDPAYWSLRDNVKDPRPVIGRDGFRTGVLKMTRPSGERIMIVTGPPGSGRRFSIDLLQRLVGTNVAVAKFSAHDLQTKTPETFLTALLAQFGLPPPFDKMPETKGTEMETRWILDLPSWLSKVLAKDQSRRPASYPAWIVINGLSEDGQQLDWDKWGENLPELVAALTGSGERGQAIDVPDLRWLFIGASVNQFPLGAAPRLSDDLSEQTQYEDEFVSCLQLAWRSVPNTLTLDAAILRAIAPDYIEKARETETPIRRHLASQVRTLLLRGHSHV